MLALTPIHNAVMATEVAQGNSISASIVGNGIQGLAGTIMDRSKLPNIDWYLAMGWFSFSGFRKACLR